jgi:hypothetical protein
VLVQSTKRVRVLDDAGIISVGQVRERFDASDSQIANGIADTNLPRPIMFSPGKLAPRFWWFAVRQQSGPACLQRWVRLGAISARPRRNQDRWSFHEASSRSVTAEATHSEILRSIERGEIGQ